MSISRSFVLLLTAAGACLHPAAAEESFTFYGAAHASADYVSYASSKEGVASSNTTFIGFKGHKKGVNGVRGLWKLEAEMDLTGEHTELAEGARYLGLSAKAGTVIAGYQDTPYTIAGDKIAVFADTIGDRRTLLGAVAGVDLFNKRARNSLMYVSPNMNGLAFAALYSSGDDQNGGEDSGTLASTSVSVSNDRAYLALAYELQKDPMVDASGMRLVTGTTLGVSSVNLIFERLQSDTNTLINRYVYGGSLAIDMGAFTLKGLALSSSKLKGLSSSGASFVAAGLDFELAPELILYGMTAMVVNQSNAAYALAAVGHGERYDPVSMGDNLSAVSFGMILEF